jgi:ubiquitin C-terminal hydrolase
MASLLPAVHGGAPILAMSGGSMDTLLPMIRGSLPDITGMSGGAMSLLPLGYGDIHATSGGGDITAASFGIVNTFSTSEDSLPDTSSCASITKTPTPLCKSLQPFVDHRVQALLNRVGFSSRDRLKKIGCGEITREEKRLTISFHKNAITLLSCDLTGTFAKFHEDMTHRHQPSLVKDSKSDKGLLSWMLGSRVIEGGRFDLITFMKRMESENPVLPLKGFRQFLSYHKEKSKNEEMDVLRYAMELYGYRTGAVDKNIYGLILSADTAVRRVGDKFALYKNGSVRLSVEWDDSWKRDGFAVFEPTDSPVVSAAAPATGSASGAKAAAASGSTATAAKAAATSAALASAAAGTPIKTHASSSSVASTSKKLEEDPVKKAAEEAENLLSSINSPDTTKFYGSKIETITAINDTYTYNIDDKLYYLRGVIHHGGGDNAGHYVYFYHNPDDNNDWFRFSDENVTHGSRPAEIDQGYVYLFERNSTSNGPRKGIKNHGNSCWMNAALQMFYHIEEYRTYVEGFKYEESKLPPEINEMTRTLQQIFQRYSDSPDKDSFITCPTEYIRLFQTVFKNRGITSQQDTMEFITKVLLRIISPPDDGTFPHNDPRSTLYNLFMMFDVSVLECNSPKVDSSTHNATPFLTLTFSDSTASSITLEKLLKDYSTPQDAERSTPDKPVTVRDIECENATKRMVITIPDNNQYVIIHLSRFKKA